MSYKVYTFQQILEARTNELLMADIIENFNHLIIKMANYYIKYATRICDVDDLIGAGMVGVTKAINKYDGETCSFKTYCYSCVRFEIINRVRSYDTTKKIDREMERKTISIYQEVSKEKGDHLIVDTLESDVDIESSFIFGDDTDEFWKIIKDNTTPLQFESIVLFYKEDYAQTEIAEMFNTTRFTINKRIRQGLKKVKKNVDIDILLNLKN